LLVVASFYCTLQVYFLLHILYYLFRFVLCLSVKLQLKIMFRLHSHSWFYAANSSPKKFMMS
jgi:hypothetical protein